MILLNNLFIKPKSENEDTRRKEFIFNIISLASIALSGMAFASTLYYSLSLGHQYKSLPAAISLAFFIIFCGLYIASRLGYSRFSAYALISAYLIPVSYSAFIWGMDLPQVLLSYALIIIMSGILTSSSFAFFSAGIISIILLILSYLQINGNSLPDLYWRKESFSWGDAITIILTLGIIIIISWLSNREIEKSLTRARISETELQKERDLLEDKVEERTRELKKSQEEKALNLYRLAEFGKMSSELFHDLINPLSALSLKVENIKISKISGTEIERKCDPEQLSHDIKRMLDIVESARAQVQKQKENIFFSLTDEIEAAIKILGHKAKNANVKLTFYRPQQIIAIYGNNTKFFRMMNDLMSNAIDAYKNIDRENKKVSINLEQRKNNIFITIRDWGCGIKEENTEKIFEPLFTTKDVKEGTGLGLYICKKIIEKDFKGGIDIRSKEGTGAEFIIKIPDKTFNN